MEWVTLITGLLLPFLQKCREKQGATDDPQEYLRSIYDPETGKFPEDVVKSAIPETRKAIQKALRQTPKEKKKDFPRYRRADRYELAEQALLKAMNASAEEAAQVMAAAAELPDEESNSATGTF